MFASLNVDYATYNVHMRAPTNRFLESWNHEFDFAAAAALFRRSFALNLGMLTWTQGTPYIGHDDGDMRGMTAIVVTSWGA